MHTRRIQIAILGLSCFFLASTAPSAQKQGKPAPSPDIPGTAIIACLGSDAVCHDGFHPDFGVADRVSPASNAGSLKKVGLSNGLLGLQVAQTVRSTFIFGFQVAGSDPAPAARWALHWSNVIYPGSGMVNVTRTGQCTWKVWSDGSSRQSEQRARRLSAVGEVNTS